MYNMYDDIDRIEEAREREYQEYLNNEAPRCQECGEILPEKGEHVDEGICDNCFKKAFEKYYNDISLLKSFAVEHEDDFKIFVMENDFF